MFAMRWTPEAVRVYEDLRARAEAARAGREAAGRSKSSRPEGLFKQVNKCLRLLAENPRHPGLATHWLTSIPHPFTKGGKVLEAYVQNDTPGAHRVFWCYGPGKGQITIIAITPHP